MPGVSTSVTRSGRAAASFLLVVHADHGAGRQRAFGEGEGAGHLGITELEDFARLAVASGPLHAEGALLSPEPLRVGLLWRERDSAGGAGRRRDDPDAERLAVGVRLKNLVVEGVRVVPRDGEEPRGEDSGESSRGDEHPAPAESRQPQTMPDVSRSPWLANCRHGGFSAAQGHGGLSRRLM